MMISVLFTILLLMQSTTAWLNYSNQVNWGGLCATGKLQSPISLDHVIAKYVAGLQTKFEYPVSVNTRLFNTDSTLKLVIDKGNQKDAFVGKLPLVDEQDSFYAYAVTLHWAMNDQNGSEHEIHDGHKSLGMHIAHYNSKYDNENAAMNDKDSDRPTIVMVAVTFTISDDEVNGRNSEIDKILKVANSTVFYEGSNASLAINLQKIIPKDMDLKFWFYLGSLSTPSCQEKAMWVVANSSLTISKAQLSALRKFRVSSTGPYLAPNARNIQNRNGREVYTSFQEEMRRGPTGNTVYLGMFFILACAGLTLLAVIKAGCCRIYNKPKYEFIEHD